MSPFDSNPEGIAGEPLREPIESYIAIINDLVTTELETTIPEAWFVPDNLHKAMQYSLMAGGKRLRPLLVVAACEALGGSRSAALPVAAAIEMVHTYSLVHDDLPAMDNDDYRRGKLTNHKVFGEATAILAGDALLTHAFYSIVQATRRHGIPAESSLAIVEELAEMAGPRGMVGGQVADMEGEQGLTSLEQLRYIHEHKTGDLFIFSLLAGGRIAGANEQQLNALREFGTNIGLAFQVQDDILDLIGDEGKLGKKTGSDIEQQKVTYPFFIGIEASKSEVERLTMTARKAVLDGGFTDPSRLLEIADYLMKRDH
ncbi:polyprenyl synthetase family protein [Paenibacillus sp. GCM10012306]|uniref:polyprenyl synthetase family protein n=1 Tax=Paenibacillus sp. GCM10012306 TaxID=3317342 RepID=UPI00360DA70E